MTLRKMICRMLGPAVVLAIFLATAAITPAAGKTESRGTISGAVTADEGAVRGLRVKAHNLKSRIWYTVYTVKGHYQIPQALAGPYEVMVMEEEYAAPAQKIELAGGKTVTVDIALKKRPRNPELDIRPRATHETKGKLTFDPIVPDEEALAKAIFVEYEVADMPYVKDPGFPFPYDQEIHDPYIAPDGHIWYSVPTSNLLGRLDPHGMDSETRWKTYLVDPKDNVLMHGITVDSKGHVYWAEIVGKHLGELDPATEKMTRHATPTKGGLFQVVADKKDDIWYDEVRGNCVGRMDAKSREVSQWCAPPTPGLSAYGMSVDQKGIAWSAQPQGILLRVDPSATPAVSEILPPTEHSGSRRVGIDSKGTVWFTEYVVNQIAKIDPATLKITEIPMPLQNEAPYEIWPDKSDNMWISDGNYGLLLKYNPSANKFTYYPLPQLYWDVPKIEVEKNNTIWFGSRWVPNLVAAHFYPNGYSASAPPEP